MARQVCAAPECEERLPPDAHHSQKYHQKKCQQRVAMRRRRARRRGDEIVEKIKPINAVSDEALEADRLDARRGPGYEKFLREGYGELLANGHMAASKVAEAMDVDPANVTRWLAAYHQDIKTERARENWTRPELLQLPDPDLWDGTSNPVHDPTLLDSDPYWSAISDVVDTLADFRATYFTVPETGEPYQTPPHQRRWYVRWFHAITQGSREVVIATPRHGKTEGLIHLDVFVICRINPNIRIIHIGGNKPQSVEFVSAVRDILTNNTQLVEDFCGPHGSFEPATRTGRKWSSGEITVATRTVTGMKAPTLAALGRRGHLPSKDADIIQHDDLEDSESTSQPSGREKTRKWYVVDLSTRKEPHTAVLGIGQRVHNDDLLGHLVDNPMFHVTVDRAHDEEVCTVTDPDNPANYDEHVDCMLWPTKNDYEWLMEQKAAAEIEGGTSWFEMVFLNKVDTEMSSGFSRDELHACRNHSRTLGMFPSDARLVAGLDPAPIGQQAGFLWAWTGTTMMMVDMEIQEGGGIPGARALVEQWLNRYSCHLWVFEKNAQQSMYLKDQAIREFCQRNGVRVLPHQTQTNRDDERFGVPGMARLTVPDSNGHRIIDLPYADTAAMHKTDVLIRQLMNWSGPPSRRSTRGRTTDVAMAAWFGYFAVIRNWMRQDMTMEDNVVSVNFGGYTPTMMEPSRYVPSIFGRPS